METLWIADCFRIPCADEWAFGAGNEPATVNCGNRLLRRRAGVTLLEAAAIALDRANVRADELGSDVRG